MYRQTSNISCTIVGNKIVHHSDVVGASPVGAAPTTSSFSPWHLASMDWANATAWRDEKVLGFGASYIRGLSVLMYVIITVCVTRKKGTCTYAWIHTPEPCTLAIVSPVIDSTASMLKSEKGTHGDDITWQLLRHYWPFVRGIHQ